MAVKVMRPGSAPERFRREFSDHCHLRHPNLCALGEFFSESACTYFTMQLVEGKDLLTYVREGDGVGPLGFDEQRLRDGFRQLAAGLWALHQAGKVHRDIKPSNVLVTADGRVVITDFGLATDVIAGRQIDDISDAGTPAYMSPEQSAGLAVGTATDWYALGTMLYEALTGRRPFEGNPPEVQRAKLARAPARPRELRPDLPADLDELCVQLLRTNPTERLSDTEAVHRLGADASRSSPHALAADTDSFQREVPFVGRDTELAALEDAFRAARMDHGVCVVVRAQAGLGKSTLVRRFLARVVEQHPDVLVCSGRCYQGVSAPFKAVDEIIQQLVAGIRKPSLVAGGNSVADVGALLRVFPALRLALAPLDEPLQAVSGEAHGLRARAFRALSSLLHEVTDSRPLVLFIDDLQWADQDSLALLRAVFDPRRAPRLLLVATVRAEEFTEALLEGIAHRRDILLEHLSMDASRALVGELSQRWGGIAAQHAARISAEGGGHPLFLSELVRAASNADGSEGSGSLEAVLERRIRGLDPIPRHVLELVSVAAAPVDEALLCDAANLELRECVTAVALLHVAQLLRSRGASRAESIEPYHDRVREAVVSGLSPDRRRELHAELARNMMASPRQAGGHDVVRHLAAAGRTREAARQAVAAAEAARAKLAFDRVVALLRTALELDEHPPNERRQLLLDVGDALCNAGKVDEASRVYLEAIEGADPSSRLECQARAINQLILGGHIEAGLRLIDDVLADIGEAALPRSQRRALASLLYHRLRLWMRGMRFTRRAPTMIPPVRLKRLDVLRTAAWGIAMCDAIGGAELNTRLLLAALDAGEPGRLQIALAQEAGLLASQGGRALRRARALLDVELGTRPDSYTGTWLQFANAYWKYFDGKFDEAAADFETLTQRFAAHAESTSLDRNNATQLRAQCLRSMGRFRALESLLGEALRDARERGDRYQQASMVYGVGRFPALCDDDPDRATTELRETVWATPSGSYHLHRFFLLDAQADIALYRGAGERALAELELEFEALYASPLLRVQVVRAQAYWLHARLLLQTPSDSPAHPRRLARARALAQKLARESVAYAHALGALVAAAVVYRSCGASDDAAQSALRTAVASADACHQGLHATAARYRLAQLVGGDERAALLSEADQWFQRERVQNPQRIVEMVAPGFPEL